MTALASLVLAVSAAISPAPSPTPPPDPFVQYETGASRETLNKQYPNWETRYLRVLTKTAENQGFYAQVETVSRFDKTDDRLTFGTYVPLGARWTFTGEAGASNSHNVLPAYSITSGVLYDSGGHWYEGVSGRHTVYDAAIVNSGMFSVEHYWNRYRVYYMLTAADLAGTGTDVEHAFELDAYYGPFQRSYFGVGYITGREVDNIGLPALVTSHVDGWNVGGRHWFDDRWAIVYGAGSFAQGNFYTRTGGHVGFDYRF